MGIYELVAEKVNEAALIVPDKQKALAFLQELVSRDNDPMKKESEEYKGYCSAVDLKEIFKIATLPGESVIVIDEKNTEINLRALREIVGRVGHRANNIALLKGLIEIIKEQDRLQPFFMIDYGLVDVIQKSLPDNVQGGYSSHIQAMSVLLDACPQNLLESRIYQGALIEKAIDCSPEMFKLLYNKATPRMRWSIMNSTISVQMGDRQADRQNLLPMAYLKHLNRIGHYSKTYWSWDITQSEMERCSPPLFSLPDPVDVLEQVGYNLLSEVCKETCVIL